MSDEQRRMYRYPPSPQQDQATLLVKRKEHSVRLIDESATGFSVTTDKNLRLKQGSKLALRLHDCWYEVQVMHTEREDGQTQVGLRRLEGSDRQRQFSWKTGDHFDPYQGKDRGALFLILTVLGFALVLLLVSGALPSETLRNWLSLS